MKTFAALALFAFMVLVSAERKKCMKTSDCEEDECCLHAFRFGRATCVKNGEEGKVCAMGDLRHHFHKEQYIVFCPCSAGLECKAESTEVRGDKIIYRNTRCAKKGTEEPEVVTTELSEAPYIPTGPVAE